MDSELLSESRSGVEISITNASTSEDELESDRSGEKGPSDSNRNDEGNDREIELQDANTNGPREDEEVAEAFKNGVSLSDERESVEQNGEGAASDSRTSNMDAEDVRTDLDEPANENTPIEVVGDRVLIERDGKFELVDASEIKAEYFEMLGISLPPKGEKSDDEGAEPEHASNSSKKDIPADEKPPRTEQSRPKTSALGDLIGRNVKKSPERRTMSAKNWRNDDYAYMKSKYGMTEEQMKIKRRREEAIAKRKREEKEREEEENRRKREDAERAFEAWLMAKVEEAKERKKQEQLLKEDPKIKEEKEKDAQTAYEQWLETKKQQDKVAKVYERSRKSEEAAQFIIRDRQLCDEAFKRWARRKSAIKREEALKKKKKKSKTKLKKKEPLPLNSKNITYYEYYGYRNNVVL